MRLHLDVHSVAADTSLTARGGGSPRYKVVLTDGWNERVEYTTSSQPKVGQRMIVTIQPEQSEGDTE